jgi:hypothetical protein
MGRPIKQQFFLKAGDVPSDVVNFKGVSIALNAAGKGYSTGAKITVDAPNNPNGTQSTATITVTPAAGIASLTQTEIGSGYNAVPTVLAVPAPTQTNTAIATTSSFTLTNVSGVQGIYPGMLVSTVSASLAAYSHVSSVGTNTITLDKAVVAGSTGSNVVFTYQDTGTGATFTVGLTTPLDKSDLAVTAYLSTGSSAVSSEIIKQEASRRYLVENSQGRGQVTLAFHDTLVAGEMKLIATDFGGATYFVSKLAGRKAILHPRTNTSTALVTLVTDGAGQTTGRTGWTTGAATGTIVTIANYTN